MNGIGRLREETGLPLSGWRDIYAIYQRPKQDCPCGVPGLHQPWTTEESHDVLRNWMLYAVDLRREAIEETVRQEVGQ